MFIEVHKVSDLADVPLIPLVINVGDIMGISGEAVPRVFQAPPAGTRATIFLRGYDGTAGTDGLMIRVSEHFDELVTALPDVRDTRLPEVKRAEPERPVPQRRSALLIVREFLEMMRESVRAECDKHESCEDCRNSRSAFLCGFRDLEDDEINAIIAEYNSEGQEASNA